MLHHPFVILNYRVHSIIEIGNTEEMEGAASKKESVKGRPEGPEKSKEEILAERKAKKAEKAAKKTGGNAATVPKQSSDNTAKKPQVGGSKSTVPQQPSLETGNVNPVPTKEGNFFYHLVSQICQNILFISK